MITGLLQVKSLSFSGSRNHFGLDKIVLVDHNQIATLGRLKCYLIRAEMQSYLYHELTPKYKSMLGSEILMPFQVSIYTIGPRSKL